MVEVEREMSCAAHVCVVIYVCMAQRERCFDHAMQGGNKGKRIAYRV